jgi:hypothetical protein
VLGNWYAGTPVENRTFGDMTVIGIWPATFLKALTVIAETLHPAFDLQPWNGTPNQSKRTCVLAALTVREFLLGIGFGDATVRSVACVMRARSGEQLGVGVPGDQRVIDGLWNGHLVATVPGLGALIDLTLFPAIRRPWHKLLTGMWAMPLRKPASFKIFDRDPIAGAEIANAFTITWLDCPENNRWKQGHDFREPQRRALVVRALRERFEAA